MPAPFEHIDAIALCRDLTPERAMELQDILASDPAAAVLLREWCTVRASLVREMGEASVDPEQFVLFVLHESGRADALTSSEQVRVEEIAPAFRQILANSPGLAAVATDIRRDMQDFEAHWAAWFAEASVGKAPASLRVSSSRSIQSYRSARRDRIRARPSRRAPAPAPSSRRRVLQAGVGVAVAAVLAALVFFLLPVSPDTVTVRTAAAEVRTVELPDGSSVRLLGDSRLTYPSGAMEADDSRRAEFEGRAFFDIVPNAERFLLVTPDAQATVLGTSFGMRTGYDGTEIILVEGSLRMSARRIRDGAVILAPGQMSRMTSAGVPSQPVSVRVHEHLAWTGLFVFHATSVRDILPMLSGRYGVGISADETLLDERVTGRFAQEESLEGTLDIVAMAIGAAVEAGSEGYRLTSLR